jgi:hypothetical protein
MQYDWMEQPHACRSWGTFTHIRRTHPPPHPVVDCANFVNDATFMDQYTEHSTDAAETKTIYSEEGVWVAKTYQARLRGVRCCHAGDVIDRRTPPSSN